MKQFIIYVISFLMPLTFCSIPSKGYCEEAKKIDPMQIVEKIHWLGQAAVKIDAREKLIYIDPYKIEKGDKADIILITHSHADHFSTDDISKVIAEKTVFVAPNDCIERIEKMGKNKVIEIQPGKSTSIDSVFIEAVPAYNVVKTNFHPKAKKWLGYILTIDGVRIYHTGDTERVPEMKDLSCDIIMLPLGQTYTMNSVKEAAEVAQDAKAKIAIPIHYGLYEGTDEDAKQFKELLKDKMDVIIKQDESKMHKPKL